MRHGVPRPGIIGAGAIVVVAVPVVIAAGCTAPGQAFVAIGARRHAELRVSGKPGVERRAGRLAEAHLGGPGVQRTRHADAIVDA